LDSSCSVGEAGFQQTVAFAQSLLQKLEMPAVQMGILRFTHTYSVISDLSHDKEQLQRCIQEMPYEPGETKLGPPLQHANLMLHNSTSAGTPTLGLDERKKVVLIVTDGDANDYQDTEHQAALLKNAGVLLVFVRVGYVKTRHLPVLASLPHEKYVFQLLSYDELVPSVEAVMRSIVEVSRLVRRAKVGMDIFPFEEVRDLDSVNGLEIVVPGWEVSDAWQWQPRRGICIEDTVDAVWEPDMKLTLPPEDELKPSLPLQALEAPNKSQTLALECMPVKYAPFVITQSLGAPTVKSDKPTLQTQAKSNAGLDVAGTPDKFQGRSATQAPQAQQPALEIKPEVGISKAVGAPIFLTAVPVEADIGRDIQSSPPVVKPETEGKILKAANAHSDVESSSK
jgi:uncharacterized protein YegL